MSELTFHIRQFTPNAEGVELEHRIALLKARDYASSLLAQVTSDLAYDLASYAHTMAGIFVFAEVPTARLEIAVKYCRHIVMAAFLAEHLVTEGSGH